MSDGQDCRCGQAHRACNTEFQYAVKVVCGRAATGPAGGTTPVAPGQYWTAINIHNPSKCEAARFRWKVTVGNPGSPGPVTAYQRARPLDADRGIEIDCRQIMNSLPQPSPPFVKGYVVIESDIELDVVAVYSTAQTAAGPVNGFHTERVGPRCVPVCEDLVLPLHTGVADWRTIAAPSGALGPVAYPVPPGGWPVTPPFGSLFASQNSTDWQNTTSPGQRVYELCFDLCFGYEVPAAFQVQMRVDDTATVQLNNSPALGVPFNTTTTHTINPAFLRAGRNCFRVVVNNTGGNTMFALAGLLRVARGKCPCSPLPLVASGQGGGLTAAGGALAAGEPEETSDESTVSRKASKKSPGRKRAGKKASGK